MPANLTPQYKKAEEEYRRAQTPEEELRCLELMLREIPKHKGTDKLQAELKAKISKARHEAEHAKKAGKKGHHGPHIQRQGAGRAIILGGPNAGKSQLLARLTRATPEVAPYPFTTREPQPGMMAWEDVQVQLIDTPPITADVFDPSILGLIRGSDLALLLFDAGSDDGIDALAPVLDRLSQTKTRLAKESYLDEEDVGLSFTQTFLVHNKIDLPGAEERIVLLREFCPVDFREFRISAEHGAGLHGADGGEEVDGVLGEGGERAHAARCSTSPLAPGDHCALGWVVVILATWAPKRSTLASQAAAFFT